MKFFKFLSAALIVTSSATSPAVHAQNYDTVKSKARKFNQSVQKKASSAQSAAQKKSQELEREFGEYAKRGLDFAKGFFTKSKNQIIVYVINPTNLDGLGVYLRSNLIYQTKGKDIEKNISLKYFIEEKYRDYSPANIANNGIVQKVNISYELSWNKSCTDSIARSATFDKSREFNYDQMEWSNVSCKNVIRFEPKSYVHLFTIFITKFADGTTIRNFSLGYSNSVDIDFLKANKILENPYFSQKIYTKYPIFTKKSPPSTWGDLLSNVDRIIGEYIQNPDVLNNDRFQTGNLDCGDLENFDPSKCEVPFLHKGLVKKPMPAEGGQLAQTNPNNPLAKGYPASPGPITSGYLGVATSVVTPDVADALGMNSTVGELIQRIVPGSPAEKIGLKAGEVIYQVNDDAITPPNGPSLAKLISKFKAGEKVQLRIFRAGLVEETLEVVLGSRP